jgi:hypothetical protein
LMISLMLMVGCSSISQEPTKPTLIRTHVEGLLCYDQQNAGELAAYIQALQRGYRQ